MMDKKHILFVTVPTYGHLIPMLELARKLGHHHQVTFAVSAKIANQLPERGLYNSSVEWNTVKIVAINDGVTVLEISMSQ